MRYSDTLNRAFRSKIHYGLPEFSFFHRFTSFPVLWYNPFKKEIFKMFHDYDRINKIMQSNLDAMSPDYEEGKSPLEMMEHQTAFLEKTSHELRNLADSAKSQAESAKAVADSSKIQADAAIEQSKLAKETAESSRKYSNISVITSIVSITISIAAIILPLILKS
jgi:hypothetical protein